MITSVQLQNAYIQMYRCMREYIWPYEAVSALADLEVSIFCAFPNMYEVRNNLAKLYTEIHDVLIEDDKFNDKFELLRQACAQDVNFDELYNSCRVR